MNPNKPKGPLDVLSPEELQQLDLLNSKQPILVSIDDDIIVQNSTEGLIQDAGMQMVPTRTLAKFEATIKELKKRGTMIIVMTDQDMKKDPRIGVDGEAVLRWVKIIDPNIPVIIYTAHEKETMLPKLLTILKLQKEKRQVGEVEIASKMDPKGFEEILATMREKVLERFRESTPSDTPKTSNIFPQGNLG